MTSATDAIVDHAIENTSIFDLHTHLYPTQFENYCLWGVDELLTYHYLIAEVLRVSSVSDEAFWAMSKAQQADLIWKELFVDRAPISEACRGVITALNGLGLDVTAQTLGPIREQLSYVTAAQQIDRVFKLSNVRGVTMTNDPLDAAERAFWMNGVERDPRFKAVLRIDPVLLGWPSVGSKLREIGYDAADDLGGKSVAEVRRFLADWIKRMDAQYVAVSLPPTWSYPDDSPTSRVIREAVVPICREHNLPFAMMIGVTRQVNPLLKLAGDSLAKASIHGLERLLAENPKNKFMVTMLSRENQHELAVTARKFRNLLVFGCWWFLNNPSLIEEITRMRIELLGPGFVPQHSDCRVLEQLLYKWDHSRRIVAKVVKEKLNDLQLAGMAASRQQVNSLVSGYLGGVYEQFQAMTLN